MRGGNIVTIDMALEKLVNGAIIIYGNLIERIVLYGSTARGTETEESDVDIAILMRAQPSQNMNERMLDLIVDLELDCGKVLSVVKIDYPRFVEWQNELPFYRNIEQEGVVLWQAA